MKLALEIIKREIAQRELAQKHNHLRKDELQLELESLNKVVNKLTLQDDVKGLLLSREEMLKIARNKINAHFLTNYETHDEIMADQRTGSAMIGFMKCWEWLR